MIRIELLKVGKDTTRGRDFSLYALCPRLVARELLLKDPETTPCAFQGLLWISSNLTLWYIRCAPEELNRINALCKRNSVKLRAPELAWECLLQKVLPIQTKMLSGDTLGDVILGKNCSGEILNQEEVIENIWA